MDQFATGLGIEPQLLPLSLGDVGEDAALTAAAAIKLPFKVKLLDATGVVRELGGTDPVASIDLKVDGETVLDEPISIAEGGTHVTGTFAPDSRIIEAGSVLSVDVAVAGEGESDGSAAGIGLNLAYVRI
jgi:hypothetical protein